MMPEQVGVGEFDCVPKITLSEEKPLFDVYEYSLEQYLRWARKDVVWASAISETKLFECRDQEKQLVPNLPPTKKLKMKLLQKIDTN